MIEYFIPKSDVSIRFYSNFPQKLNRIQKAYPQPERCPYCDRRTPTFCVSPVVERDDENEIEILKGVEWICHDCWQIRNLDMNYFSVNMDWLTSWYATVNRFSKNLAIRDLIEVVAENERGDHYKSDLSLLKTILEEQNV